MPSSRGSRPTASVRPSCRSATAPTQWTGRWPFGAERAGRMTPLTPQFASDDGRWRPMILVGLGRGLLQARSGSRCCPSCGRLIEGRVCEPAPAAPVDAPAGQRRYGTASVENWEDTFAYHGVTYHVTREYHRWVVQTGCNRRQKEPRRGARRLARQTVRDDEWWASSSASLEPLDPVPASAPEQARDRTRQHDIPAARPGSLGGGDTQTARTDRGRPRRRESRQHERGRKTGGGHRSEASDQISAPCSRPMGCDNSRPTSPNGPPMTTTSHSLGPWADPGRKTRPSSERLVR